MKQKVQQCLESVKAKHGIDGRPLTIDDFFVICRAENITVIDELPLTTFGFIYYMKTGEKFLALSNKLKPKMKLKVAFHEIGHYFMHKPETALSYEKERIGTKEKEANLFAKLATARRK